MSPEDANTTRGSLDQGEQVRWQFDVPEEGITFSLRVEQGRMVMYASTQTTSPSEAFYEWKAETSSSTWVFIKPTSQDAHMKHNSEINNLIKRAIPVYMALIGLNEKNTFALKRGEFSHLLHCFLHFPYKHGSLKSHLPIKWVSLHIFALKGAREFYS